MTVTETLWWSELDIARKVVSLEEWIKTNDKMTNIKIWSVIIFGLVIVTIVFGISEMIIFDKCFW